MCNSSKKTEFEMSRKFVEKSKIGNSVTRDKIQKQCVRKELENSKFSKFYKRFQIKLMLPGPMVGLIRCFYRGLKWKNLHPCSGTIFTPA